MPKIRNLIFHTFLFIIENALKKKKYLRDIFIWFDGLIIEKLMLLYEIVSVAFAHFNCLYYSFRIIRRLA